MTKECIFYQNCDYYLVLLLFYPATKKIKLLEASVMEVIRSMPANVQ